jgi:hypothetical protein
LHSSGPNKRTEDKRRGGFGSVKEIKDDMTQDLSNVVRWEALAKKAMGTKKESMRGASAVNP